MNAIFSSGTSAVLLNGVPGKTFHCKRGVRQGDPLSPLLFVSAADFLQSMINKALQMGLLRLPIPLICSSDFPVIQYADDTLIIMEGDVNQLFFLKSLLNSFSMSTGLRVNFNKSMMVPINVPDGKLDILARTFGCSKGSLPFTYLGLPLHTERPKAQDYLPLISKCERRLSGISSLLSLAGRLQMTNAVFSTLPTFFMCSLKLPKGVIKQIDKFRKHCLWRGSAINPKKMPKAAWKMVCAPKIEGGLGVIDIEKQNKALLLKNLHKFFNKADVPWVDLVWEKHYRNGKLPNHNRKGSFWWRDNLKLLQDFKSFASPQVHCGDSSLFWSDAWHGMPFTSSYPEFLSFALDQQISVKKAFSVDEFTSLFQLPLSQAAFLQFQTVQQILIDIDLDDTKDKWIYSWGSHLFASAKVYRIFFGHSVLHPVYGWLWKSNCQPKHKVFFWLLIKDRLSTRNILRRRGMDLDSYSCVFCSSLAEETLEHLFVNCPFSIMCWNIINVSIPIQSSSPEIFSQIKDQLASPFAMDAIILLSWSIWNLRNELIFSGTQISLASCRRSLLKELSLLQHRMKPALRPQFSQWLSRLGL